MESFKVTAPTRADLAGGTLDIWPLYCIFGESRTINVALNLQTTVKFQFSPSSKCHISLSVENQEPHTWVQPLTRKKICQLPHVVQFPLFIVNQYLLKWSPLPKLNLNIRIESSVPVGSSLGGSSTLCVALIRGLSRIFSEYTEQGWQREAIQWIRDIEAAFLNLPTGTQDALAALYGGLKCYISGLGEIRVEGYSEAVLTELSDRLLVLYSGESHHSGLTNWEVIQAAISGDKEICTGLSSIRVVAEHLDRELRARKIRWSEVGKYLNEEWRIRESMLHVDTKRLKDIVEFLNAQKVLGCKVCGAANGGSLIVLVDPERRQELAKSCASYKISVLNALPTVQPVEIK